MSVSFKEISALLYSAGVTQAGAEQVPFNSFNSLLLSWPRTTEVKRFILRKCLSASSCISWQCYTTANSRELDLETERISIFTSRMPPVEQSRGLLIPKITAPSKNPMDFPRVVTATSPSMVEKQRSSQKLLKDLFGQLQPTKSENMKETPRIFLAFINQGKHAASCHRSLPVSPRSRRNASEL